MSPHPDPELRRRWRGLIEAFDPQQSTLAEFCRRHQVSTASFYAWRRRLAAAVRPKPATPAFVPIRIDRGTDRCPATVQIHLPGSVRIEVPAAQRDLLIDLITRLAGSAREGLL